MVTTVNNVLFIAHRGESYLAPENTMASINLAWENGAEAVEIDVRLTSDNEIVVIHDKDTKRTGNKNLNVETANFEELKSIDVGSFLSSEYQGEKIPGLNQAIASIPPGRKFIIEIKSDNRIIPPLVELVKSKDVSPNQVEFISFKLEVITAIKKQLPEFTALWLLDLDYYYPAWLLRIKPDKIVQKVIKHNLDGVNVWAGKFINHEFVQAFKQENLKVYTWTVNEPEKARQLMAYQVDAITTDRPAWLKKQLENNI